MSNSSGRRKAVVLSAVLAAAVSVHPAGAPDQIPTIQVLPATTTSDSLLTSNDHLVPPYVDEDVRYASMLAEVFRRGFAQDVRLRVLGMLALRSEWVGGIRRTGEESFLFAEGVKPSVWSVRSYDFYASGRVRVTDNEGRERTLAELFPQGPPTLAGLTTNYQERIIDREMETLLDQVWSTALQNVKAPSAAAGRAGADGETYYFWQVATPSVSGRTWSPDAGSRMAALVAVAGRMAALARADDATAAVQSSSLRSAARNFLEFK
jgi:hypothetical protein